MSSIGPVSSRVSAMRAADPPVRREETLAVALLPPFAGGCLGTCTWITRGVLANALLMVLLLCEASPAADASRRERGTV
jgi:hypothetical protein